MKKKFTMLFAALLAFAGVAKAQTLISDASTLSNEKVYTVAPSNTGECGVICVKDGAESTQLYISKHTEVNKEADANDPYQRFAFIKVGEKSFMYSIGAQKFVADNGAGQTLLAEPSQESYVNFPASTGGAKNAYPLVIEVGDDYLIATTQAHFAQHGGVVTNWNHTDDAGAMMAITEYEPTANELTLLAAAYEACETFVNGAVTVTYNFVYEGNVKYTQTTTVVAGRDFPDYTISLPFGVKAAAKPEGKVSEENATQEIELTVEGLPFNISALTDGKFGENMAWYHLTMRNKDVTYEASTGKAKTGNVAEKNAANLFAFTGNPFDGYSIYNYAAGAGKVLYPANSNDGTRAFFIENASSTWLLYKNTDGYQFRMKDAANGWLNDHQPDLAIWNSGAGATDGGSTFTFTLVENPDLKTFYEVTYKYMYEGDVKATETLTVEDGSEYPACTYHAPYGVIIGAKPAGKVEADGAHEITLTVEKDLPFVAATEGEPTTWYYAQMHANNNYKFYLFANEEKILWNGDYTSSEGKKIADDAEIESYLWGFVGNLWEGYKMVNKKTGKAVISTGSGVATVGNLDAATAFIASNSKANGVEWFCMKHPEKNQYLNMNVNSQGGVIEHWSDNDNGSSIFLTEYNKEYSLNISVAQYATYYSQYRLAIPETVKAYVVAETTEGNAVLEQVKGVLPAYTGVILEGEEGVHTFVTSAAETATIASNKLQGSIAAQDVTVADNKVAYILANKNGVGLYKVTLTDGKFTNGANKAYMVLDKPVEGEDAPAMFVFSRGGEDEDTTGIDQLINANGEVVIYDLSGRRVEKMEKGIYIVNGKKVVK